MLYDSVDRPEVEKLVYEFYDRVLQDELVGPFFVRKLGPDINAGKWYGHLSTLKNFWLMMMNGEKNYWGDPLPAHAFLGPIPEEAFVRWLELFRETVDSLFVPEIADKFYQKSEVVADQLMQFLLIGKYAEDDDDDY